MLKRRKRGQRRRRQATLLLFFLAILMLTVGPFLWRLESLRHAESVYDVQKVKGELLWLEGHGGLLNNLELIQEAKLWLELNVGSKGLETKLVAYQDEKHRFWLFLIYLQEGKLTEAQNVINQLDKTPQGQLGQGLMSLAKGDAQETRRLLDETEMDWKTLSRQEQNLRCLTLAQAALIIGDNQSIHAELLRAQQLEPNNPACLSVEFDVAIGEGQWAKALELSDSIDAQTWRPKNALFETKKAVLAIHENNIQKLSESLTALKGLPQGDACINYVKGIEVIKKGELQEGKNLLERALKSGFEGGLKADTQKALQQVTERQKADQVLRAVVDGNAE